MKDKIIDLIHLENPWLLDGSQPIVHQSGLIPRPQSQALLNPVWDDKCSVIVGPRQAGKTTIGKLICQQLIHQEKRFDSLLYLNCDHLLFREWLDTPLFIKEARDHLPLKHPIVFIDEAQRLESPGLLLKSIIDLKLPIKLIASGSSQLEFKSKIQEHLTGRQFETIVLPLSIEEYSYQDEQLVYGAYPGIVGHDQQALLLEQLYKNVIHKDLIEILRVGKPDIMQKLIALMGHSSGQLVNYQQLSADTTLAAQTVQNYLDMLEATYILKKVTPFVGNKRKEVTTNPVYYFIDNGFRNCAIQQFAGLDQRQDAGFLVENFVFQELYKYKIQHGLPYQIHYWRTQSGAEVDFILDSPNQPPIPIEVKYRNINDTRLTRGYHSFIEAYQPQKGFVVTKDFSGQREVNGCLVEFVSIRSLNALLKSINKQ